jgi:hypothetical protein
MTSPTTASIRAAVEHAVRVGRLEPHQLAAFSALDRGLTPEQRQAFTVDWRAQGSPAAPPAKPPAARPANPLSGFPYFSQLNAADGPEGGRQCQTSAIAMCLAYLKAPGIRDDTDYLRVVQRHGDTTVQATHQKALAELGVQARFTMECTAAQAQAEIRAGLPVAMGYLHRGPVGNPSGGGHWLACYGFDAVGWNVMDPYGDLDMVNGGWLQKGGNSGRGLRYSYRSFNPRWLVEGPANGYAWLFS